MVCGYDASSRNSKCNKWPLSGSGVLNGDNGIGRHEVLRDHSTDRGGRADRHTDRSHCCRCANRLPKSIVAVTAATDSIARIAARIEMNAS